MLPASGASHHCTERPVEAGPSSQLLSSTQLHKWQINRTGASPYPETLGEETRVLGTHHGQDAPAVKLPLKLGFLLKSTPAWPHLTDSLQQCCSLTVDHGIMFCLTQS